MTLDRMGGPTSQVYTLSLHLARSGNECVVHTSYSGRNANGKIVTKTIQGVQFVFHPSLFEFALFQITPTLLGALLREPADVIHAHGYRDFQTSVSAVAARLKGVPLVLSPHGSLLHHKGRADLASEKIAYDLYDLLSWKFVPNAASRIVVESLRERKDAIRFGIPDWKVDTIRYGFDSSIGSERSYGTDARRRGRLLTVCRLAPVRNIESLIQVTAKLKDRIPNITLTIVGEEFPSSFSSREKGYSRHLHELADRLGISNIVNFPGWLTGERLWNEYKSCDVFVWSAYYDSFAYELVEAAAFGKPIVSTKVGIAEELIESGTNGFLVDQGDIDMFEIAVERLLDDDSLYKAACVAIRQSARRFSIQDMINRHFSLYQSLVQ